MGRPMFNKSLIQFSLDGWGCVPSPLFDLRPNYGRGMKIMAPPSYGPVHALLHSVTPTHASAGDSWTLTGKSGSVSCSFLLGSVTTVHGVAKNRT